MKDKHILILLILTAALMLTSCAPKPQYEPTPTPTPIIGGEVVPVTTPIPGDAAPVDAGAQIAPSGPDTYPANVNPLTGLTVSDPAVLNRPPLIVRVSNSPSVVRPQSGLNSADHVWEHVVEGFALTRFSAVFLGELPDYVGSVRSGRPPDFELDPMYEAIYYASGFSSNKNDPTGPMRMRELMRSAPWFARNFAADFGYGDPYAVRLDLGPEVGTEHTLFAVPAQLWQLAAEKNIPASTTLAPGLAFDMAAPAGGIATSEFSINYPGRGPTELWRYDAATGGWLRWTCDEQNAIQEFEQQFDKLTNEPINFENVVVVYAQHYETDWIEDEAAQIKAVAVNLTGEGEAVLMRDGMRYEITWRREASDRMIQFFDAAGNVIPFKPGSTWFQVADYWVFPPEIAFQ